MEKALSRIPFTLQDELMIISMAKWMRFIAVFNIIVGALVIAAVAAVYAWKGQEIQNLLMNKVGTGQVVVLLAGVAVLIVLLCALAVWSGKILYDAADNFDLVAKTDIADQDYLAAGFSKLKTYFTIVVISGALSLLGSVMSLLA